MENVFDNEIDFVEDMERYRKNKWGYIAKIYSKEEEKEVYNDVAKLISAKYGYISSYDEIVNDLAQRGKIYTMDITTDRVRAFYEIRTGNVALPHFINRISTISMHEFVHKKGFEISDESFKNMSVIFNEAGTEIVSAKSLSDEEKRDFIFKGVWAKFPEKVTDNFLAVCLVSQLNDAVGGETLERSILKGTDFFKQAIIDKYGEATYVFLKENMEDLSREEAKYWGIYRYISDEERAIREEDMKKRIYTIQDCILEAEFDKRLEEVKTLKDGKKFLEDLKKFGLGRVRIKKQNDTFEDPGFEDIFNRYKEKLEASLGKLNVSYDESEWEKTYQEKEDIEEITDDEKKIIRDMSIAFYKQHKPKNSFSRFWNNIFNKQTYLGTGIDNKKVDKLADYRVDINYNVIQDKSLNETKKSRRKSSIEEK